MRADGLQTTVTLVEVRFEDLAFLLCERGAPNTPHQLFGLAAEHHAANNFDPTASSCVIHAPKFAC